MPKMAAATCVSNTGLGTTPVSWYRISISCEEAWKIFTMRSSVSTGAITERSRMPNGSMMATSPSMATCTRQSLA